MSSFENKSGNGFPSRAPISKMSMLYLTFIIKDIIFEHNFRLSKNVKKCLSNSQGLFSKVMIFQFWRFSLMIWQVFCEVFCSFVIELRTVLNIQLSICVGKQRTFFEVLKRRFFATKTREFSICSGLQKEEHFPSEETGIGVEMVRPESTYR